MLKIKIEQIHEACGGSQLEKTALLAVEAQIRQVAKFLRIGSLETALLSVIAQEEPEQEMNLRHLRNYLGFGIDKFSTCRRPLLNLAKAGLIRFHSKRAIRNPKKLFYPDSTRISVNPRLALALESGDMGMLKTPPVRSLGALLEAFQLLLEDRKNKVISIEEFLFRTATLCNRSRGIELVKMLDRADIHGMERALVLGVVRETLYDDDNTDAEAMVRNIGKGDPDLELNWLGKVRSGEAALFQKGLIEAAEPEPMESGTPVRPAGALLEALPSFARKKTAVKTARFYKVLDPAALTPVEMHYEEPLAAAVRKVGKAMQPGTFEQLKKKLLKQGGRNGLTILLYGASGTGKTETVYQLARATGRRIMSADAAQIQNAFVGVAEKNVRNLFGEYRNLYNREPLAPILLFNEADALLQKRRAITSGLDAHDNALQNILLQELEDFEGIFIGTSNLPGNMDSAFERRFLFRLEFRNPGPLTRISLLKSRFSDLPSRELEQLGAQFSFSGAQVEKVWKKVSLESVVDPDFSLNAETLGEFIRSEAVQGPVAKIFRPIGFQYSGRDKAA